ncbi:hypothetical protein G6F43_011259 [Rhizopus delemar]|nr:hypothetical protein G6F43_011259 [Rhizopus delemar]
MPPLLPVNNVNSSLIMSLTYYTIKIWTSILIVFSLLVTSTTFTYVLIYHARHRFSGFLFLDDQFYNALMNDDLHELPTFKKDDTTYSTIDYIFVNKAFRTQIIESNLHKLNASWADRSLLSATCCLGPSPSGSGLWRGNPLLARKLAYQHYLRQHLDHILLNIHSGWTAQKKWDSVKRQVKKVTCTFAIDYSNWRRKMTRQLESDRSRFLRSKPPMDARLQHLTILDQQIASLQQELSENLALKAILRWKEAGETSVKYLKNLYRQRTVEQYITTLRPNDSTDPVECIDRMLPIAQQFYQPLYTTDPVDGHQVEQYLADIQGLSQLSDDHTDYLLEPITIDEIIHETDRVENKVSSPREDGLGYAFLCQLFRYPPLQGLVLEQELMVRLLAKKGNLTNLKNWRPISLINCDAKIYTRIINSRMRQVISSIINRCQTGFMPNRFITESGLVLNMVTEHARWCNRNDIALLLDQEKAYDRVHSSYLRAAMLKLSFLSVLVNSIIGLFFGNRVWININGHFTNEINQYRGLRQGDPLLPLLFNLVLEPFLQHITQYNSFLGFPFAPLSSNIPPPPALKVLAYADDVCVFLSSPEDFVRVQYHLHIYGQVSNAKVNLSKTEAIFLNGYASPSWQQMLLQHQIVKWHDHTKPQPLRYLGFPAIQSLAQRRYVESQLLQNVKTQCGMYSQRQLSIRGRVILVNTLILSKLWYFLRVVSLPKHFLKQIRSIIYQFIMKGIKPGFQYALLCQPIIKGGLGLLDPLIQHRCLQFRWLRQLFQDDDPVSCSQVYMKDFVQRFHSIEISSLFYFFFPALHTAANVPLGSFLPIMYDAIDSFLKKGSPDVHCNPYILLNLPLLILFSAIPSGH